MELKSSITKLEPWGVTPFDCDYTGLPNLVFNLLRACNKEVSISTIGHFLKAGIELDQRVALVSFDHPAYLLASFKKHGFYLEEELLSEQLIYLYYKPVFSHSLNFSTNYRQLLDETKALSRGDISRIAFLNADVLFNLETHLLAESSAERIMASFSDEHCVVLGCYQATDIPAHQHLDEVSKKSLNSYLEIKPPVHGNDLMYELILHKTPVFHAKKSIDLYLTPGFGFNVPKVEIIRHG